MMKYCLCAQPTTPKKTSKILNLTSEFLNQKNTCAQPTTPKKTSKILNLKSEFLNQKTHVPSPQNKKLRRKYQNKVHFCTIQGIF